MKTIKKLNTYFRNLTRLLNFVTWSDDLLFNSEPVSGEDLESETVNNKSK